MNSLQSGPERAYKSPFFGLFFCEGVFFSEGEKEMGEEVGIG